MARLISKNSVFGARLHCTVLHQTELNWTKLNWTYLWPAKLVCQISEISRVSCVKRAQIPDEYRILTWLLCVFERQYDECCRGWHLKKVFKELTKRVESIFFFKSVFQMNKIPAIFNETLFLRIYFAISLTSLVIKILSAFVSPTS